VRPQLQEGFSEVCVVRTEKDVAKLLQQFSLEK